MRKCAGHRILALNRGEKEKILTVKIVAPEEKILRYLNKHGDHERKPDDHSDPAGSDRGQL